MQTYQDILVDQPQEGILLITLNRPDARNALRNNSLREIAEALRAADDDSGIRAVVITGGELAMHVDILIAGAGARFSQPEINLGTIPGAGGTQRLIKTVGKPLAMKMVLSGEMIDAATALASGLAAEVTDDDKTLSRALALAALIAGKSPLAIRVAKEAVLRSFELGLEAGLNLERKSFSLLAGARTARKGLRRSWKSGRPGLPNAESGGSWQAPAGG